MLLIMSVLLGAIPENYTIEKTQVGLATTYWPGDGHSGKICADGKPFTAERCHIAHRLSGPWRLGRKVRVCSLATRKCTISFIGDAGSFGACDHRGIAKRYHRRNGRVIYQHQCLGKWLLKIRRSDPGTWRGIADLSRCVTKKIGGPGMQIVRLDLLVPSKERTQVGVTTHPTGYPSYSTVQTTPYLPTLFTRRHTDPCCLWPWRSSLSSVVRRRSTG